MGIIYNIIILAFVIILLEKFIIVIKTLRGYNGIVIINTASSNIFLLILYLRVVYINIYKVKIITLFKLVVVLVSIIIFIIIIFFGVKR